MKVRASNRTKIQKVKSNKPTNTIEFNSKNMLKSYEIKKTQDFTFFEVENDCNLFPTCASP